MPWKVNKKIWVKIGNYYYTRKKSSRTGTHFRAKKIGGRWVPCGGITKLPSCKRKKR